MNKVAVALSGGLDSSIAAALLKEKGFEVIGLTMKFSIPQEGEKEDYTKAEEIIKKAKQVCEFFGIEHYVIDCSKEFKESVISNFIEDYLKGKTPNPCVECNRYVKFGKLLKEAKKLGADFLATGHYAKIEKDNTGKHLLKRGRDQHKEQSYFLYGIQKEDLPFVLFPLADMNYGQVIEKAKEISLSIEDRPSSQEICFVTSKDYGEFIKKRLNLSDDKRIRKGLIKNKEGKVLGEHKGICFYTIGQRQGLGIAAPHPLYVVDIDADNNQLIVGSKKEVQSEGLLASNFNLYIDYPQRAFNCWVKIRYNASLVESEVYPYKDKLKIIFKTPQAGVSPGQSVVLYDGDTVLGGGIIEKKIEINRNI